MPSATRHLTRRKKSKTKDVGDLRDPVESSCAQGAESSDEKRKFDQVEVPASIDNAENNISGEGTEEPPNEKNNADSMGSANEESDEASGGEEERVWVQCNICEKWRSLPAHVDPNTLPDVWSCEMNKYDSLRNVCSAPEEKYRSGEDEQHAPLKSFLKLWTKRLQNADRAEHKISSGSTTRAKKRKSEVEWIQCSNPSCGKWRSIARFIDSEALLRKLNCERSSTGGNSFLSNGDDWFCSMNFWDDTTASCAAPQEALSLCRWNLA